ncbi:hypothetical protein M2360_002460 [Rhizobium sp. SG_E_25_P2]|uniref:hypothetical protein n=1 Tax=Rhizobium sp. SG_E_25_P2 TaxID=2879942 RepID=UPI002473AFAF|nr:hypothetical protein [Rhizobium sp. SG_E_25_P2]MDH6267063.1 hypothetical protein [Rhizobium sp. SG_E_25_P2]
MMTLSRRIFLAALFLKISSSPGMAGGKNQPLPTKVSQCAETSITEIGGRLEGDETFETGTFVVFANEGMQIGYDRVEAIVNSKIGDPVRMCLTDIPKDCPPGDERGRSYRTTNLRTGESWEMADSQHMCGGA